MSPISAAVQGITGASVRYAKESAALLRSVSGASDEDAGAAIVGQIQAKTQFAASVRTLTVADEMLGELLSLQEASE
ncbi:MAG: hypothetical protein JNJ73_18525 [Hyphomonadaceae bacterium]|nr:hypothetical protein [Hyphomonadaceae bacterium]